MTTVLDVKALGAIDSIAVTGKGNQAEIRPLPRGTIPEDNCDYVLKEYRPAVAETLATGALDDLISWHQNLDDETRRWVDERFCWPRHRVVRDEVTIGVILPHIPSKFYTESSNSFVEQRLDWIYFPHRASKRGIPIPDLEQQLFQVFAHLAEGLGYLSNNSMHHGDISQRNVLWSKDLSTYLIDCDGMFIGGLSASPVQGSPGWIDPRVERREIDWPDQLSDIRAFACGLARCLAGEDLPIEGQLDVELLPEATPGVVSRLLRQSVDEQQPSPSFNDWSIHLYEQADTSPPEPVIETTTTPPNPSGARPPEQRQPSDSFLDGPNSLLEYLRVVVNRLNQHFDSSGPRPTRVIAVGTAALLCLGLLLMARRPTDPDIITIETGQDLSSLFEGPLEDGMTIHLEPGNYFLDTPIRLTDDVEIRGIGPTKSTISVTTNSVGIMAAGQQVALSNLLFTRAGVESAKPLIHVTDTALQLSSIQIVKPGGPGLLVDGSSTGTVRSLSVDSSTVSGIVIGGQSNILIELSESSNNGLHGFEWLEDAVSSGIELTARRNEQSGFDWSDQSNGELSSSNAESNGVHGFTISGQANLDLALNTASDNTGSGMYWEGQPVGIVEGNKVSGNGRNGYAINTSEGILVFRSNESQDSELAGFYWAQGGPVDATYNSASGNTDGFVLGNNHLIELFKENEATSNHRYGVYFDGSGNGVFISNTVSSSGADGIYLNANSDVLLRDNIVMRNQGYGFDFSGDQPEMSRLNAIVDNELGDFRP